MTDDGQQGGAGAAEDYVEAVERCYRRLRGRPLVLSPADARQVLRWHADNVPLGVVLRTLEDLFDRARGDRRRAPRSLAYCDEPVRAEWERVRELARGAHAAEPARAPQGRDAPLERAALAITASHAPEAARLRAAERLRALARGQAGAAITMESVRAIEDELLAECLASLDDGERDAIRAAAEARVERFGRSMSDEVFASAVKRSLARQVRECFGLPDLARLPAAAGEILDPRGP